MSGELIPDLGDYAYSTAGPGTLIPDFGQYAWSARGAGTLRPGFAEPVVPPLYIDEVRITAATRYGGSYTPRPLPFPEVATVRIAAGDLDARAGGSDPGVALRTSREMDLQLPRKVSLKYLDAVREYDDGEQYAERLGTLAQNQTAVEMPLVLTAEEAAAKASILLSEAWLGRYAFGPLNLPAELYRQLEPGDTPILEAADGDYALRIVETTLSDDGRLEVKAQINDFAAFTPGTTGEEGGSEGQELLPIGASYAEFLDMPAMLASYDKPGFFVSIRGEPDTTWNGAVMHMSQDGGATWAAIKTILAPGQSAGIALDALGAGDTYTIDKTGTLTVQMLNGDLESVTELQMLNGANHFAYGAAGRWEIIAAQNCVEQLDGTWVLTDFLRGRYGTEWAMTRHQPNDRIYPVSTGQAAFVSLDAAALNQLRRFRIVTLGQAFSAGARAFFAWRGANLKPFAPVLLNGHRSGNDWTLAWTRRTRVGGEWRDLVDAPLGEATEAYEIDIHADGSYATVLRTLAAASATVAYTEAQQVADFGAAQSTLYVKVYQLSAAAGRGYPLTASITR